MNIFDIQEVFEENNITLTVEQFLAAIKQKEKEREEILAKKPIFVEIFEDAILSKPVEGETIWSVVKAAVKKNDYWDLFYEREGMSDDGADELVYFKIGDKFYEVKLHCEAEWVGDWSVRKNLPGEVSAISIVELENYKVSTEEDNYIGLHIQNEK